MKEEKEEVKNKEDKEVLSMEKVSALKVGKTFVEQDVKELTDSEEGIEGVVKEIEEYPEEIASDDIKEQLTNAAIEADKIIVKTDGGKKDKEDKGTIKDEIKVNGRTRKRQESSIEKVNENKEVEIEKDERSIG